MTKISVENLGPIVKGEVDLRPLTIFIGPSNTGKSFLATMIYALAQLFYPPSQDHISFMVPSARRGPTRSLGQVDAEVVQAFDQWRPDAEADEHGVIEVSLQRLPPVIAQAVERFIDRRVSQAAGTLSDRLEVAHGSLPSVVRRTADSGKLLVSDPALTLNVSLGPSGLQLRGSANVDGEVTVGVPSGMMEEARSSRLGDPVTPLIFVDIVSDEVLHRIADGLLVSNGFYLPAARSGVVQTYKRTAESIVRRSSPPPLPGCVSDFISHLITMDSSGPSEELQTVVSFIESEISRGAMEFDDSAGLPYPEIRFWPAGDSEGFGIARTSSMISDLAPLVLFLKHLVLPGDLLILEEPEAHLHPAAQRQMARALVRLVNAGVKVLITTHSEFLLSQINNLMRLSHASRQTVRRYGYESQDCLMQDEVSAYAFRRRDELGGSAIEELTISPDVGIDEDDFAKIAFDLYDETTSFQRFRGR
jgi:hypothetical protein